MTPHVTAELWERRHPGEPSVHLQRWPTFDPELVRQDTVTMVVQVNGKVRDRIEVDAGISEGDAEAAGAGLAEGDRRAGRAAAASGSSSGRPAWSTSSSEPPLGRRASEPLGLVELPPARPSTARVVDLVRARRS